MPIYDGCLEVDIKIIDVRHEQAATHAADAWARVNPGKIGVAVVTAGPGVTDAVTGVANAWRANSPMLCIGGQGPFANKDKGSLQEMDHVGLMKPITKWAGTCYHTARLPEYIAMAMRHAVSGTPGPVFLEVPMDVLMESVDDDTISIPVINTIPPAVSPDRQACLEALRIITQAKKPVLMAGTSVKWSMAQESLNAFLDQTHIPAYVNGMGRGTIPPDSPHLFGRTRRAALEEADVVILAGVLLDFRMRFGETIPKSAKIIQLDMDSTLMGHNRAADVALVGNLSCTFDTMLRLMNDESIAIDFRTRQSELRTQEDALAQKQSSAATSDDVPIKTSRFCAEIAAFVAEHNDMIVIGDGGDVVAAAAKVVPIPPNGGWMDPGPLGTLGVGMPFALAAQAAHPKKPVLIIYGDGSFGLNGFEFDTAVRFNLPIVGIVGNDAAWGQMMRPQKAFFNDLIATQLGHTRYDKVVEALGGHGEFVEHPADIRPALERAFQSGKPALVNVILEQDQEYQGGAYI
jgi:acetolactate synthase-1/2/3 large subunit